MRYFGKVYRPPSEANSLIIQVTLGCSHNKCTFCSAFREKEFSVRPLDEVLEDFNSARKAYSYVEKIFLADGDALVLPNKYLVPVLKHIKKLFPECQRVGAYASATDILRKKPEELIELQQLGLGIVYLGLESGSEKILQAVEKNIATEDMIAACHKLKKAGITSSVTMISGLGGVALWQEHALESALVVSQMDPDYLGLLTLMVEEGTELYDQVKKGEIQLLTPREVAIETKLFLEKLMVTNCVFRSNHASNYLVLKGILPGDKERLIVEIEAAIARGDNYRPESYRRL
ncbi:MAG: radical SAM protein [Clostridia bacterium]|nr:radical SAM protein [Clostridia bacterium]